jgi:YfiH family protein
MIRASILQVCDGIRHGYFTRQAGVSSGIYASLNCGPGSGDSAVNVQENRSRVAGALEVEPTRLVTVRQVHSAKAVEAESRWAKEGGPEADAIVTSEPGLAIGVLTADCAPVLLCDPEARVIGAAHAGWRGALTGIIEAVIAGMEKLGGKRARIVAAIGPAISKEAYEVGAEFQERFLADDGESAAFFSVNEATREPHFDLSGYVADRLSRAGISAAAELGLCTYCDETRFFSYRRSQHHGEPDYGRQISAIVLA